MTELGYPAARLVADRLYTHFAEHHASASVGEELAPLPEVAVIEKLLDVAFWTSLRREEQHPPRISIAFVAPEQAAPSLLFESPLHLKPSSLTRVAPGVERPGIHLGVWNVDGELKVWGATRMLPPLSFVIQTVAPGVLVVKHRWTEGAAKFFNVAVLEADQIKMLENRFAESGSCPTVIDSLFGGDPRTFAATESSNVLIRLAVSMQAHGRGGTLLVVPSGSDTWRESIAQPLSYSVFPPYSELTSVVREAPEMRKARRWQDALSRSVEAVAGLTAIDGATVITDQFEVLAFGAKIVRPAFSASVEHVALKEPIRGAEILRLRATELGGTRHLSAAQFAHDQHDALAFVASQDGPFTIFSWTESDNLVHGYRVESLLL